MKKILFLNVVKNISIQKRFYPLSFGYLKAYAKKNGEDFISTYEEHLDQNVLRKINPDVVAMTSVTENYNRSQQYAQTIKRFNSKIKIVIGGIHISSVPESLNQNMDVGIIGEGEQTFLELLQHGFEPNLSIDGLVYRNGGTLLITSKRDLIEPLDNIPHPDRSIFWDKPRTVVEGASDFYMFSSRGCTNRCKFCSSSRFWEKLRLHSAKYVIEEIIQLKDLGAKNICFYDDTFLANLDRAKEISEAVKDFGLTFHVTARANQISDESAKTLKKMNVVGVGMGLESQVAKSLLWLQKGNTPEINQKAIDILKVNGLRYAASFIKGIPGETQKEFQVTLDFIKQNNIPHDLYTLVKFPNTPLYEGSTDWDSCSMTNVFSPGVRVKKFFMRSQIIHKTYRKVMRRNKPCAKLR
jgi:anaerobic magnesium-protoporphyrin IX monomethyl ester cyclase